MGFSQATVQAALGTVALDAVGAAWRAGHYPGFGMAAYDGTVDADRRRASLVATTSLVAILATAPLAALLARAGDHWLAVDGFRYGVGLAALEAESEDSEESEDSDEGSVVAQAAGESSYNFTRPAT